MLDLEWLLAPCDRTAFFEDVWQKQPKLLASGRPGHFAGLFDKAALEHVIEFSQPHDPSLRLASASTNERVELPVAPNGRINVDQLRKHYLRGQTVILNSVEDFSPRVAHVARSMETEMGARVQVNCYLTPASAQGFHAHYDTHDVLVAQVEGEKLWKVYSRDCVCPLNEMIDGDPKLRGSACAPDEVRLRPGDLLYIPRGWVHEAETEASVSLHLTFGIHPPLGKDLLNAALESLVDRHPMLREALPVGPLAVVEREEAIASRFAELMALFTAHASAGEAANMIDDQLLRRGRSGGDGHLFADMERVPHLTADIQLKRRADLRCRLVRTEEGVALQFLNGLIRGPEVFEAAMRFVAERQEPFAIGDLPGLEPKHRMVFATSLLTDGLCRISEEP